jgi:hypothetical protein
MAREPETSLENIVERKVARSLLTLIKWTTEEIKMIIWIRSSKLRWLKVWGQKTLIKRPSSI